MSKKIVTFTIDGEEIKGKLGQTIMEAADEAGVYIPRLCYLKGLTPHGSCRVCVVNVNGRSQTSCTQPITEGMVVENDTADIQGMRRDLVDMLFVEGNHICPSCEKSGNCELQAVAYKLGITAPKYPFQFPRREMDATHPDIFLDRNRCILCARCVEASRDLDGKTVFEFVNRGPHKEIAINSDANLADTKIDIKDKVVDVCPVGSILKKRVGFSVPVGKRNFDKNPIGAEIEK
ncbi:NAD-reducing [NiFe] hydrogenase HoxFUYH(E), subunit gamma (HoxU) [hydrothermal vent metagenome]|uniref:NAD-reducing [NiFe] hydrogenase HoxFUYH(E), subunit gamma (HoxU) n=1 Tax=hydrothermal vent metagenome TaxID=652676 RepID=A0A3B1DGS9_9ZZZZ